jgi:MFS family permease
MLKRLELPLSVVIGFTVLSQLFNVLFLRVWGPMADRFGYKVVLSLSASLYLLVILGWAFTTLPERYFLTIPLLVILHIFAGIAAAGVNLSVETFGLKLAPAGQATPYLVGASLATSIGAAAGPLAGGWFADFFSVRDLAFNITWNDPFRTIELPALFLTGYDFLFAMAFLLGLLCLNTLNALKEQGEVSRDVALNELMAQTREMSRGLSIIPGLGVVASVPYHYLRRVPGIDVAMGVTAFQLSSSVYSAVTAAAHGRDAAVNIAGKVSQTVSEAVEHAENIGEHGLDIARHATRGAIHAVDEIGSGVGHLTKESVIGVLNALGRADVDPLDVFQGAGYGAMQAAGESGADLGDAASQAVEGAREAAQDLGLSEDDAAAQATIGIIEAAEAQGEEALEQVKSALSDDTPEVKLIM